MAKIHKKLQITRQIPISRQVRINFEQKCDFVIKQEKQQCWPNSEISYWKRDQSHLGHQSFPIDQMINKKINKSQQNSNINSQNRQQMKPIILQLEPMSFMKDQSKNLCTSVFFNTKCASLKYFRFKGRKITYIAEDRIGTQLLGSNPIAEKNEFSVKVTKTKSSYIVFGVIDSKFQYLRDTNWSKDKIIYYKGSGGRVCGDGVGQIKRQGKGVKKGEIVTVRVDQQKGKIVWFINGKKESEFQMKRLKNKEIKWVPYLHFLNNGDGIEWIE